MELNWVCLFFVMLRSVAYPRDAKANASPTPRIPSDPSVRFLGNVEGLFLTEESHEMLLKR